MATLLAKIRIPIPPEMVGPVLVGLGAILLFFGVLLCFAFLHMMLTKKKAIFGPNSRIVITGKELVGELVTTGFYAVVSIAVAVFCFLQVPSDDADQGQTIRKPNVTTRLPPTRPGRLGGR